MTYVLIPVALNIIERYCLSCWEKYLENTI